jgi:hypothetical protein
VSLSYSAYLGPYFRCKTRTERRARVVAACPNPTCPRHGKDVLVTDDRYCPLCGTPIGRTFPVADAVTVPDRWAVAEAIGDVLCEVAGDDADFPEDFGYHLWIPNEARPGAPKRGAADSPCGVEIILDEVEFRAERHWMDDAFPERSKLVAIYGGGCVETRWGLLRWCS